MSKSGDTIEMRNGVKATVPTSGAFLEAESRDGMVSGSFCMPADTSIARYLDYIAQNKTPSVKVPTPRLFPGASGRQDQQGDSFAGREPFLSVIVRTQGKRIEELTDVLLCLMAQQEDDFELLIIGHKVAPEAQGPLLELIESFPPQLTRRIRYYAVDWGSRTAPLQVGFAAARGHYVTALDDDDLVMDTWVSEFKKLAAEHDGCMLHTYNVTQEWKVQSESRGEASHKLCSASAFNSCYCHPFDAASQLHINTCPFMSLAFPRFVFDKLGFSFDERLTTTEDWDFLMRVYAVCGVADGEEVTSIYRLWTNAETSHTLHNAREWDRNYTLVVDKMNDHPYLLGPGAVEDIRSKSIGAPTSREALIGVAHLLTFKKPEEMGPVWGEVGTCNFGDHDDMKAGCIPAASGGVSCDLSFHMQGDEPLAMVAFAPVAKGYCVLGEFTMRLIESDGTETEIDFAQSAFNNGYQVDCNHIVYLKNNPFVAFEFPRPMRLTRVDLTFKLLAGVPEYYIDQVTLGKKGLFIGRARRWLSRKTRGRL